MTTNLICYQCERPALVLNQKSRCITCVTANFEKTEDEFLQALAGEHPAQLDNKKEPEDIILQAISAYSDGWYDGYIVALEVIKSEFDSQTADYALMGSEDAEGKSHYGQANKASERLKHLEAKAGRAGFDAGWTARTDRANGSFKQAAEDYVASIAKAGK